MNQSKKNDPRTWGKAALGGGVSVNSLSGDAVDHLVIAQIAKSRLDKGATVCRPKGSRGYRSLRQIRNENIFQLGQQLMTR